MTIGMLIFVIVVLVTVFVGVVWRTDDDALEYGLLGTYSENAPFTRAAPPTTLRVWERQVQQLILGMGWEQASIREGDLAFVCSSVIGDFELSVFRDNVHAVDCLKFRFRPKQPAPDDFRVHVVDHRGLLRQLLGQAPVSSSGGVAWGRLRFDGPVIGVLRYFWDQVLLSRLGYFNQLDMTELSIDRGVIAFDLQMLYQGKRQQLDVYGRERAWKESTLACEQALRLCIDLGRAMRWQPPSPSVIHRQIMLQPQMAPSAWRALAMLETQSLSDEETLDWLLEHILDESADTTRREAMLPALLSLQSRGPHVERVLELVLQPENKRLLGLMFGHEPSVALEQLEGPHHIRWFAALLDPSVGLDPEQRRAVASKIEPSIILSQELEPKLRGALLSMLLSNGGGEAQGTLVALMQQTDDEDLAEILTTLSVYANENVARSVVVFARNPEQIDTAREYQAMLMLFKNLSRGHAAVMRTPAVERFLCECVKHPDERIASMALSLLETLGADFAVKRLTQLLGEEVAVPSAMLTRTSREIRKRMGEDMNVYSGGLSIAAAAGGELTQVTGEGGALTIHEDGGGA